MQSRPEYSVSLTS